MYAQSPWLARSHLELVWSPVDLQTLKKCFQWRQNVGDKLQDQVRDQEKIFRSLFSKVLGAKDPETGNAISYNELLAESQFLLVAGEYLTVSYDRLVG